MFESTSNAIAQRYFDIAKAPANDVDPDVIRDAAIAAVRLADDPATWAAKERYMRTLKPLERLDVATLDLEWARDVERSTAARWEAGCRALGAARAAGVDEVDLDVLASFVNGFVCQVNKARAYVAVCEEQVDRLTPGYEDRAAKRKRAKKALRKAREAERFAKLYLAKVSA